MYNITLNYFDINYTISSEFLNGLYTISTGNTTTNKTFDVNDDETTFECDTNFINNSNIKDNIIISLFNNSATTFQINGIEIPTANLNYYTSIKSINGNKISIDGKIPLYVYNDLSESGYSYRIRSLHFSEYSYFQMVNYINASPFGKIIKAEILNNKLKIKPNSEYKYFDFSLLNINFLENNSGTTSTSAFTFETDNQYTEYELKPFVDNIFFPNSTPINIYNENSLCKDMYHIQEIYDTTNNCSYSGCSGLWYPIQSSRYKIIPIDSHLHTLKSFKPYTYIDFGFLTKINTDIEYEYYDRADLKLSSVTFIANKSPYEISDSGRTLITEVTDEYMIIEKPFNDLTSLGFTGGTGTMSGITGVYDIVNVTKIVDIDNILLKTYLNIDDDYYHTKSDSERYRISAAYGRIIKDNSIIRNNSTGIIYQDENDLFNLDIFNVNIDDEFKFDDPNLLYKPIEIYNLGIDKKIKTPIPIEIENIEIQADIENIFISGETINYNNFYQEKSFIWNSLNIDETNYSIIEWSDRIIINSSIIDTKDTQNNSNSKSLLLLTIKNNEIINTEPIYYEWVDVERRIDNIKLIKNNDNIDILITHFDNRDEKTLSYQTSNIITDANNNGTDVLFYNTSSQTFTSIEYSANTSISFFDIVYDTENHKYMLGRYYHESPNLISVDNTILDLELNYTSILTKSDSGGTMLWNKKIRHLTNPNATTGPIISELEIDDKNNLYLFGNLTNFDGYVEIGIGDFSSINHDIIKPNHEKYFTISKFNSDGITLWNKIFKGSDNSLFLNPIIKYYDKFIYFSFDFSENIEIEDITYTTESDQIINSIFGKMNRDTGNIEYIKLLKSNNNNNISDFSIDEDYIYCIGEFKGEAIFDNYVLFSNGESGYILKIRKSDGIILNKKDIYSDDKLVLKNIVNDSKTISISGSWSGNIYVERFIKNSDNEEFFITNIKKKDI